MWEEGDDPPASRILRYQQTHTLLCKPKASLWGPIKRKRRKALDVLNAWQWGAWEVGESCAILIRLSYDHQGKWQKGILAMTFSLFIGLF